jgi:iron only hydrogenase large subunit-like protein
MPCTAKKFEAQREEMTLRGITHNDAVLTTRELASLIKLYGIDMQNIEPEQTDAPYNLRSSAARLYAVSGGVAEAVIRTLNFMITGNEMDNLKINELRSSASRREYFIKMGRYQLGFAVVSGLAEARKMINEIRNGRSDLQFIEVMACEGGCIYGGGQPIGLSEKDIKARAKAIYEMDDKETIRVSHKNPGLTELMNKLKKQEVDGSPVMNFRTSYSKRNILL